MSANEQRWAWIKHPEKASPKTQQKSPGFSAGTALEELRAEVMGTSAPVNAGCAAPSLSLLTQSLCSQFPL